MVLPGRQTGGLGRYGFNGKEQDPEVKGSGAQYDYGFRIYDPRLGKFLSVDPLMKDYPHYSPYHFAGNNPIRFIDMDGLEPVIGDPNYGRNLIFGNTETVSAVMPNQRDENNENWLAYRAKTLDDALIVTTDFKKAGYQIENVYIQAHGSIAGFAVTKLPADQETDISNYDGAMANNLSAGDIKAYLNIQRGLSSSSLTERIYAKEDYDSFDPLLLDAITNIQSIANNIADGGNLIIAGCHSGLGNSGTEFINAVSELVGSRINVLASEDFVGGPTPVTITTTTTIGNSKIISETKKLESLDRPLSGKYFEKGWKIQSAGALQPVSTEKDLQLNSTGTPITPVDDKKK